MTKAAPSKVWFPYTQMKTMAPPLKVVDAEGSTLILEDGTKLIDAISSWWCTIHGYKHPRLVNALKQQVDSLSHVMLGGLTHNPVERCAQKLVEITPDGLEHVFFSDSGSVGMEVSMKLAVQYWKNKGHIKKNKFISLKGAYHGDTTGVMSICDPEEGMHNLFKGFLMEQFFVSPPQSADLALTEIQPYLDELETLLKQESHTIAAFVLEPLMLGAGGFQLYSPIYLNEAKKLCEQYEVLLIFDEVATGFGRTGTMFAADQCDIVPDILTLGKGLTGGMLGLAATMTSSTIFEAFYDDNSEKAFMHGPTFMGNPLACAVALESITLSTAADFLPYIKRLEALYREELQGFTSSKVVSTRVLGNMACIEMREKIDLDHCQNFFKENGVWLRPFGKYLYLMPAHNINLNDAKKIISKMKEYSK